MDLSLHKDSTLGEDLLSGLLNKDMFGKPNEGVHSYRVCNVAIIDVIMTIFFAYCLAVVFKFNFGIVLCILFTAGIIGHRIFGVRTTVDKLLFSE